MSLYTKWYPETYYHVYNMGNNHNKIFFKLDNYQYFLEKVEKYLTPFMEILAFVLIPNHFHFITKIKDEVHIDDEYYKNHDRNNIVDRNKIIGQAFANFFNCYTKSINKQENRTGGLFSGKCQRNIIKTNDYLIAAIAYLHFNPLKHQLVTNSYYCFNYLWSSYRGISGEFKTKLNKSLVLEIFNGLKNFKQIHYDYNQNKIERKLGKIKIE